MAPIFDYKAFSGDGKAQRGNIDAENAKAARLKLKKQGLMVTDIREKTAARPGHSQSVMGGRVGVRDIALMTRQLASLIKANIPLVEALNAMVEQSENEKLKVVLEKVKSDVNEGSSLAKAMTAHPKVFDTIYVNMIEAGESSGTLGLVLLRLADLKEAQMRLRNKIISGMTYPVLMMVVACILMILIFTFVIPKIAGIFESMNKPVPLITRVLIVSSEFTTTYWPIFLGAIFLFFMMFKRYINSAKGRPKWDQFKLSAPLFGSLVRLIAVTRFANTMGTLLASGVPILTAMNIAKNLVDNAPISQAISQARENITEGQSIAEPLRRSGQFPPLVIHMIAIGEKTGELPDMLRNVAETYEEQVNSKIDGLTSLVEPMMIVGMGLVVAFVVIAIFVPLMDISNINT